jgi:hypothetical protein
MDDAIPTLMQDIYRAFKVTVIARELLCAGVLERNAWRKGPLAGLTPTVKML